MSKEADCKICGGIFGDVIKDDMCSHCTQEEKIQSSSININEVYEDNANEWPEDQEENC